VALRPHLLIYPCVYFFSAIVTFAVLSNCELADMFAGITVFDGHCKSVISSLNRV
jgi:hypothetical protein